jgi:hypothetical protein
VIRKNDYVYKRELPRFASKDRNDGDRVAKEARGKRGDLKLLSIRELYNQNGNGIGAVTLKGREAKFYIGAGLPEDDLKVIYMELESFLR